MDQRFPFLAGPPLINVLDSQDEPSAGFFGKVVGPQSGVGVAEVQRPGR